MTTFPIPSPLHPVVIILIVISINHLEIKVRKETIAITLGQLKRNHLSKFISFLKLVKMFMDPRFSVNIF